MVTFQTFPLREVIGHNENKSFFFSMQEKKIMLQEKYGSDFVTFVPKGL